MHVLDDKNETKYRGMRDMEHEYKVGDMVTSLVTECDVTKGKKYKVIEVDYDDAVCPVRVEDNAGDGYWMLTENIAAPTADQYIRILEAIAGEQLTTMARNIDEALQDAS